MSYAPDVTTLLKCVESLLADSTEAFAAVAAGLASSSGGKSIVNIECSSHKALEQSDVATLRVKSCDGTEDTLFLKHVDLISQRKRMRRSDDKWRVTALSFCNEYAFYDLLREHEDIKAKASAAEAYANCYVKGARYADDEFDVTYTLLLQNVAVLGYEQRHVFTQSQAESVIRSLAHMHAAFWTSATALSDRKRITSPGMWGTGVGGWWHKQLRPSVKYEEMVHVFQAMCADMPGLASLQTDANISALQWLAEDGGALVDAYTCNSKTFRTVVHGDPKSSNMFLRPHDNAIVFVDFQWAGPARSGFGDVVYFLCSAVENAVTSHFEDLVSCYIAELSTALDASIRYSNAEARRDLCLEYLDFFKTALAQLWPGLSPGLCEENRAKFGWLTNEFEETIVRWMCQNAIAIVKELRETAGVDVEGWNPRHRFS